MISKRWSFECDMGKYSTRSINKVWAFRRTPYSLDMCCISHIERKINNVCIFSHDQVMHHIKLPYIVLNLQLEYDRRLIPQHSVWEVRYISLQSLIRRPYWKMAAIATAGRIWLGPTLKYLIDGYFSCVPNFILSHKMHDFLLSFWTMSDRHQASCGIPILTNMLYQRGCTEWLVVRQSYNQIMGINRGPSFRKRCCS